MVRTYVNFQSVEKSRAQKSLDVHFLVKALNHGEMSEEMKKILLLFSAGIGKGFYIGIKTKMSDLSREILQ